MTTFAEHVRPLRIPLKGSKRRAAGAPLRVARCAQAAWRAVSVAMIALLISPAAGRAQDTSLRQAPRKTARKPPSATASAGPSMAVTQAWIETEMPALTHHMSMTDLSTRDATDIRLQDCQLSYTVHDSYLSGSEDSIRVPLAAVDGGSIHVSELESRDQDNNTTRVYSVILTLRNTATQVIKMRSIDYAVFSHNDSMYRDVTGASIPVTDKTAGDRVVRALRHAVELCGAPKSPF